ncbi:RNA methyltransferase [Maribellus comscasis]|uniref:RNA methyltransferase n=1 Tax=Maribellus comscasis TaxID=2681766 RepID=A0A6I6JL88_9BACT|nr:RNA methyltransferase [Maribellus comscasis]QGY43101.1 RNA methyltransferase [Maribellus comscasis]
MISKNKIKLIHSLSQKKYRKKENLFLVEGDKNVLDVLQSKINIIHLFATQSFITSNKINSNHAQEITEADTAEIKKASLQKNPQNCIALCKIPPQNNLPQKLENNLSLFLDGIQDPGNLGTILRISDWFGIEYIFCSPDTADIFNPKVVQSSMGSICRTKVIYSTFEKIFNLAKSSNVKITGTFLEGENIYAETLPERTLLIMGNEGNGIRKENEYGVDKKIMIPHFAINNNKAESLNVAVATGIICSEFRRQQLAGVLFEMK